MEDPLLGRTVAQRYRLISLLGTGSVSSVYLARHAMIARLSAIKLVSCARVPDPIYRERFLREARAVNRINHPNIVEISDYGEADGLIYLVMEYVPGESLARILKRGPLGVRRAARIGLQIASALGRAHQVGVIHHDLNAGSILVVPRRELGDWIKLTDFGVAETGDLGASDALAHGLPSYVAPERRYAGHVDPRSDLFALGAVLYEATTGERPFPDASSTPEAHRDLGHRAPRRLIDRVPAASPFFDDIVMTLLAPDPDDRPRDGFEVAELLRRLLDDDARASVPPRSSEPPRLSSPPSSLPSSQGEEAAPHSPTTASAGGPNLSTIALEHLGPLCTGALERVVARARSARLSGPNWAVLEEARRLCGMVEAIGALVVADSRAIEASQAKGRAVRSDLGRRIDTLARERSKTLGWAGTIAERAYVVQAQRLSGQLPIPTIDAMIWEQAALEQEEDAVRAKAAELAAQAEALQRELDRLNEEVDRELLVAMAGLEGRAAALRALALEAWMLLEKTASILALPRGALLVAEAPTSVAVDDPVTDVDPPRAPVATSRGSDPLDDPTAAPTPKRRER